jgi:hypothetical protein
MLQNAAMRQLNLAVVLAVLTFFTPALALADELLIKNPGDHPTYTFEAEPHAVVGFGGPFRGGKGQLGAGFRGTVVIVDNGFIKTINNSVGITFGGDFFFGNHHTTLFIPVAMQWNFWLSTHWSVFGEPGLGFAVNADHRDVVHPILMAGGRYHFTDKIALTLRLGYPAFSVGASFFL